MSDGQSTLAGVRDRTVWSDIDLGKIPGYEFGKPPKRLDDVTFDDEFEAMWGRNWGACSKIGKLRTVLLSRPGPEETSDLARRDPAYFLYPGNAGVPGFGVAQRDEEFPDLALMRRQHEAYARVLAENGVEVLYADFPPGLTGIYGLPYRGAGYPAPFMIRKGCIIGRSALAWKRGQEAIWAKKMLEMNIPVLYMVHGSGIFEGRLDWLDPKHVLLNVGHRANREGFRQMEWILKQNGVEEAIPVELPASVLTHLDVVFTMVDRRLALIYSPVLSYDVLMQLKRKGIRLIDVPREEMSSTPCNALPLEPGKIVMPKGAPKTVAALREEGVTVIEVDLSESCKLGAGPDCITLSVIRDEGPYLDE